MAYTSRYKRPKEAAENLYNLDALESKRGDVLNRFAYGLLSRSQKESLFTCHPDLPVTYAPQLSPKDELRATLEQLPLIFEVTSCVSITEIRRLHQQVAKDFPTEYAAAQLVSLIYSLAYQSTWRGKPLFEIPTSVKQSLADGLSPVFDIAQSTADFYRFVHRLNDRAFLTNVSGTANDSNVLTVAISYKHMPHLTTKLSKAHLHEIALAVPLLANELGFSQVQIWIDRILAAKKAVGDRSWWERGLAPFLELPVLYVSGPERADEALIREMDTMWINIERVAGCIGRGMVSYGRRFDRGLLAQHGITFNNARASRFDWWMHERVEGGLEERFSSLLFAMGNTTMLERETYFEEDRDALLEEGRRMFCEAEKVIGVCPVTSYAMRDDVLWKCREGVTWVGMQEWCVNFVEEEPEQEDGVQRLVDAVRGIRGGGKWEWRSFEIEDKKGGRNLWLVVCPRKMEVCLGLAVQIVGEQRDCVGMRAPVVVDSPIEFLEWSKWSIFGNEGVRRQVPEVEEMLRGSGVLRADEKVVAVAPHDLDDELFTKRLN